MDDALKIEPLKDDTSAWREKSFWRDLLGFFFSNSVLEWRLRKQLKSRPNVWGIGLWPDAEHEEVAKICAEGFAILDQEWSVPNPIRLPKLPLLHTYHERGPNPQSTLFHPPE